VLCDPAARRAANRRGKSDAWHSRIENAALGEPEECSFQCPRPDSNGHARYGHRPSTCRVYQFHHGGSTIRIIIDSRSLSNACSIVAAEALAVFVNRLELAYTGARFTSGAGIWSADLPTDPFALRCPKPLGFPRNGFVEVGAHTRSCASPASD